MDAFGQSVLGKTARWPQARDASLLFAIPRAQGRAALGVGVALPFVGVDLWNAFELSWLDARGKPQVALAELRIDATSPCIVESKSLKLYLGSYAQTHIDDQAELTALLTADLGAVTGTRVTLRLIRPSAFAHQRIAQPGGVLIDDLPVDIAAYGPPDPGLLHCVDDGGEVEQTLVSHLLKSNCPVTGQPDWASVEIHYRGAPIDPAGVLRYIVSYRQHSDFHEHCVERMFVDLMRRCQPRELDIYARYTRRGGIDINPWRSTARPEPPENVRHARQ